MTRSFNIWLLLPPSALSCCLLRLQRPGSSPGRLMEDALTFAVVSCSSCHLNNPESPAATFAMTTCQCLDRELTGVGIRHKSGRNERKTGEELLDAGRRCSYSVVYHRFKISVSYFDKGKSVKKTPNMTGQKHLEEGWCAVKLHVRVRFSQI